MYKVLLLKFRCHLFKESTPPQIGIIVLLGQPPFELFLLQGFSSSTVQQNKCVKAFLSVTEYCETEEKSK